MKGLARLNRQNALATLFGVGFAPRAPGTVGSAAAMSLVFLPEEIRFYALATLLVFILVASPRSIRFVELSAGDDASEIVIDEVAGIIIILLNPLIYNHPLWLVLGFAIFRALDILKPGPIGWANSKKGPFWVIADDALAALFTSFAILLFAMAYRVIPFLWLYLFR